MIGHRAAGRSRTASLGISRQRLHGTQPRGRMRLDNADMTSHKPPAQLGCRRARAGSKQMRETDRIDVGRIRTQNSLAACPQEAVEHHPGAG
jgi:hypothetical protein